MTTPKTRSLTWRLGAAMALTAVLGAVLAGLLAAPLLASTTRDAVRDPLARQADLLGRLSTRTLDSQRVDALASRNGLLLGVVDPDGTPHGVASALAAPQVAALDAGEPVSTRATYLGTDVLIEGRPTRDGGAVVLADGAGQVDSVRAKLVRRVVLALLTGLAVALVAASVAAGRVGRPLREVAAAARRMAAGERGVPVPASATTEVADVSAALAGLDRALATSEARQRSFLLSVSHELRTPLTTVRGYAEGLAEGVVGPEEAASVGRTLAAEADRMERYVADLLALARLEADDFSLDLGDVDMTRLLRDTADTWRDRAARDGIAFEPSAPATPLTARTDAARLRQVLDILLDNACRVCAAGDRVVLEAAPTGAGVRVEVRDSGPGLTADDAAVAFEPGVLHERYAATRPGGHGLGLAIAHRLVSRLGGRITVATAPEGGAAFVIDLPG